MRMKSLILIFIALGCGLVASIGISQVMNRDGSGNNMEVEQILVALVDIDIGARFDAQNVKLEDWPKAKVPEGAIRRVDDVKEKYANARFFKGEPIHISRVTDQLGNVATKVPQGYRAMPVKVDEDTVMKAISPGDRVDVMVFLRRSPQNGIKVSGVFTILKNVRVFAVNTNTERATAEAGEAKNFRTVSLLVKPEHGRELALAALSGKILLTLRRPDETDVDEGGEDVTPITDLLEGGAKVASEPNSDSSSSGSGLLGLIKGGFSGPPAPASGAPAHSLILITPSGAQQYDWQDANGLPVQTSLASYGGSGSPAPSPVHGFTPRPASEGQDADSNDGNATDSKPASGADKGSNKEE